MKMKIYETILSAERVAEIEAWIENIEIDESELSSYHYDDNPYGVCKELRGWSGEYVWDEDEYAEAQCEVAIQKLQEGGVEGYFDVEDDELILFDARDDEIVDEFIRIVEALRDGMEIKTKGKE